jgi:hypothetical protein
VSVAEDFGAFVDYVLRGVTYAGRYAATVIADHGDAVDIEPDDEAMRGLGLQNVPKRTGTASGASQVEPGTRCLFGFVDSKPTQPFIAAWDYEQHSAVISFDSGRAKIARYGDSITVITEPVMVVSGVVAAAPFIGTVTLATPVYAVIQAGAEKVFA